MGSTSIKQINKMRASSGAFALTSAKKIKTNNGKCDDNAVVCVIHQLITRSSYNEEIKCLKQM